MSTQEDRETITQTDHGLPCQRCGYDLRGLNTDGRCPECNAPVFAAVQGDSPEFADPEWLSKLSSGANNCLRAGGVLLASAPIRLTLNWIDPPKLVIAIVGFLFICVYFGFAVAGIWQLGTPDPRFASTESRFSSRRLFRSMAIGAPTTALAGTVASYQYGPSAWALVLTLGMPFGLLGMVSVWGYGQYMGELTLRIRDTFAARKLKVYVYGYLGSCVLFVPGVWGTVGPGGGSLLCALIPGIAGVLGFGVLILFGIPSYISEALEQCRKTSETNWSTQPDGPADQPIGNGMQDAEHEPGSADRFASALDRDDFTTAAGYVHPECVYESPGGQMVRRDAIIDSYRKNAEWARATFDRLEYESRVEPLGDGRFRITYTDRLWHTPPGEDPSTELAHAFQCQQVITLDNEGLITHIEHAEIPGQREALEAYFQNCGIKRPT